MVDISLLVAAIIFLVGLIIAYIIGLSIGSLKRDKYWEREVVNHRKDAIMRSRAVLTGNFSEQLAPFMPDFNYAPTECRFIGKPIVFVVFKGMDKKEIEEIVFVEVKSRKSELSPIQKSVKKAIDNGQVRWEEYRVPGRLTRDNDE